MHCVSAVHKSHSYINTPSQKAVLTKCFRQNLPGITPLCEVQYNLFTNKCQAQSANGVIIPILEGPYAKRVAMPPSLREVAFARSEQMTEGVSFLRWDIPSVRNRRFLTAPLRGEPRVQCQLSAFNGFDQFTKHGLEGCAVPMVIEGSGIANTFDCVVSCDLGRFYSALTPGKGTHKG